MSGIGGVLLVLIGAFLARGRAADSEKQCAGGFTGHRVSGLCWLCIGARCSACSDFVCRLLRCRVWFAAFVCAPVCALRHLCASFVNARARRLIRCVLSLLVRVRWPCAGASRPTSTRRLLLFTGSPRVWLCWKRAIICSTAPTTGALRAALSLFRGVSILLFFARQSRVSALLFWLFGCRLCRVCSSIESRNVCNCFY